MFVREIKSQVNQIKGIGDKTAGLLAKQGVISIGDLLLYYPHRYDDRSVIVPLRDFNIADKICNIFTVIHHEWFGIGKTETLKVHIQDETGSAVLACFGRPFLEHKLTPGKKFFVSGHFFYKYGELQSSAFDFEEAPQQNDSGHVVWSQNFGIIIPIYHLCANLKNASVSKAVKIALAQYGSTLQNDLPQHLIERYHLLTTGEAIRYIHFPKNNDQLIKAKKTLIYTELFYMEIVIAMRAIRRKRASNTNGTQGYTVPTKSLCQLQQRLIDRLPFKLTQGQLAAIQDVNYDMTNEYAMSRLLQGEVGSGKTLVAFLASLFTKEHGGQCAVMAPTELLARQHAENAAKLLEPLGINAAFLTGNVKSSGRKNLLKALENGDIDLVLGTHALFSRDVVYKNLNLVVIDEQHRFGVTQRQAILSKGENCNLLMMSATPIPRSLALTVFGDMDVSEIKGLPHGRQPITTHLLKESNEMKAFNFIKSQLDNGYQAYFVYPLIEANEGTDLKDAVSMLERLKSTVFPTTKCALLHSKLNEDEKKSIMEKFRSGEIKILCATSVVEVGVDVPNATCMVIEHAERFGLSALHQLRGRVGRGSAPSHCLLIYSDDIKEDGKNRLEVIYKNTDGFVIAEKDLELRGPGQIIGTEQSGYLKLGIAEPARDAKILSIARDDAFMIIENDPQLLNKDNQCIKEVLERAFPFGVM
ncbi:MAG: ATP-dependent DNA helicase RecG [Termitinemataceae bacterium]|nr:MAG: ATP-dependent DNA helicase RecG [Termitinemataceae bacterium]